MAVNPHTPATAISEVMHMLDAVLVMTVNPGFGGQTFLRETLPKIRQLRAMIAASGRQIDLVLDGGMNTETVKTGVEAGADVFVVGSEIFSRAHSVDEGMKRLRAALEK